MKNVQRLCHTAFSRFQKRRFVHTTSPRPILTYHNNNKATAVRTSHDDTSLVDRLLVHTSELMTGSHHHVVAYSGGVDSSLVAALLQQCASNEQNVQAVLGISPSVSQEQVQQAQEVAELLRVKLVKVQTNEQSNPMYISNQGQACFACKTHLYSAMTTVVDYATSNSCLQHNFHLYNGTNVDDLQDDTRVGLIAAREFHVKSPLAGITKHEVRRAARWLGLPNHDAAASPCLRSRLALGVQATQQHLAKIELAERRVRNSIQQQLGPHHNMRVRMLAKQRAMIEIDEELVKDIEQLLKEELEPYFLKELGFQSVAVRPFKSGSVSKKQTEQPPPQDEEVAEAAAA